MGKNDFFININKIHFIGIGGISMSALALFCKEKGFLVSGSDVKESSLTDKLKKQGIKITEHDKRNVKDCDLVVYNSAITNENEELKESVKLNIPLIKRSELLGRIIKSYKESVAISGSHGKTTATAMLTHIISKTKKVTAFIGGEDKVFSNYIYNDGDFIIAEACEYKKNFLDLEPKIAVVLNIDNDHLDSYKTLENEIETFKTFAFNKILFVNADDENAVKIKNNTTFTFGITNKAEYTAKNIKKGDMGYSFSVYAFNRYLGRINLKIQGKHNIYNALSAIAVADYYKIGFTKIKEGLENFTGVKRRFEKIGRFLDKDVFCDYAHHPKEIETLFLGKNLKNYAVIFQPHTYSRTEFLMDDFIKVLKTAKNLIIYKTYPAREEYNIAGDAQTLFIKLKEYNKKCLYVDSEKELKKALKGFYKGIKAYIFVGAGDIYDVALNIIKN